MNWKESVKPTQARMVLFLVLVVFLVGFFVGMYLCTFSYSFEHNPLCNVYNQRMVGAFLFFILVLPQLLVLPVLTPFTGYRWLFIALSIIIGLAYLYFLACLILWIYGKVRAIGKKAKK